MPPYTALSSASDDMIEKRPDYLSASFIVWTDQISGSNLDFTWTNFLKTDGRLLVSKLEHS